MKKIFKPIPYRYYSKKIINNCSNSNSEILHSLKKMSDEKIIELVKNRKISQHKLEYELKKSVINNHNPDCIRAVRIRRKWLQEIEKINIGIPFENFDYNEFYNSILGKNCENVIGYIPIPLGIVGPLKINGEKHFIPMATTEGALVASTNRGCKAINLSGGLNCYVLDDKMTRSPLIKFINTEAAIKFKKWLENENNYNEIEKVFNSTSNYGKLISINTKIVGRNMFIKFNCKTGDAMGMNIVSKGVNESLSYIKKIFPNIEVITISGNLCIDKKPSAINIIEGRGKYTIAECEIEKNVLKKILKVNPEKLIELNYKKNFLGSALAGSIGGNNAHASNIVSSIFLATGQDVAQNIESSACITLIEESNDNNKINLSVTMPCLEVGTIGGGTSINAQKKSLEILNINGNNFVGDDSEKLAKIISSAVLAGELSLLSALSNNELVKSHLKLNR